MTSSAVYEDALVMALGIAPLGSGSNASDAAEGSADDHDGPQTPSQMLPAVNSQWPASPPYPEVSRPASPAPMIPQPRQPIATVIFDAIVRALVYIALCVESARARVEISRTGQIARKAFDTAWMRCTTRAMRRRHASPWNALTYTLRFYARLAILWLCVVVLRIAYKRFFGWD